MARDLEPAPLKPSWPLRQTPPGRLWVPLVHAARVEEECALASLDMPVVRVPEHDCVGAVEAPVKKMRQRRVRVQVAETERPQQRLRFLHPPTSIAVYQDDAPPFDGDLAAQRKRSHVSIVVTSNSVDRSDSFECGDRRGFADVARMENQVDAA